MTDPIQQARATGRTTLTEPEAKTLLARHGIGVPDFEVAQSPADAVESAEEIGYPVAVKVAAPTVQHKSEWADGAGIHLECTDGRAVERAAQRIRAAATESGIEYTVLVEESVDTDAGVETIVGGTRDPSFGPTLLFGLGGVLTEVMDDVTYRLAPVSPDAAVEMTREVQVSELLSGFRGRPPVDRTALGETIATLGRILVETPGVSELEINPLLATAEGTVGLDALVVLEG